MTITMAVLRQCNGTTGFDHLRDDMWPHVPELFKDDILFALISTRSTIDFRILYGLGLVARAREIRNDRDRRRLFYMLLHQRFAKGTKLEACDALVLRMIGDLAFE